MKNNQGFTLVELLAVIVVLAIVITIAVPSTMRVSNKIKENMFCTKIDFIENAAKLYGEDKKDSISKATQIKVSELVETGYLKKDQDKEAAYIQDPRDKLGLDENSIKIYIKNNRIYVAFWEEAANLCDKKNLSDVIDSENKDPNSGSNNNLEKIILFKYNSNNYQIVNNTLYVFESKSFDEIASDIFVNNGSVQVSSTGVYITFDNGETKRADLEQIGSGYIHVIDDSNILVNSVEISSLVNSITCTNCFSSIFRNNQKVTNGYVSVGDVLKISVNGTEIITRTISQVR